MYMTNERKTFDDGVKFVRERLANLTGNDLKLGATSLIWDYELRKWKNSRNDFCVGMHTECLRIIQGV